jgi:hypothetical protein
MNDEATILTTEHFTSQTVRSTCLQDMQGRASLFLTAVSGSLVALSFIGSATKFGTAFLMFTIALLATLWFLGFLTFLRIAQIGVEDTIVAFEIARIRHRYIELVPEMANRITRTVHDDIAGLQAEMGGASSWWQVLMPTQSLITFIVSIIAAVELALILTAVFHLSPIGAVIGGLVGGLLNLLLLTRISKAIWNRVQRRFSPQFPSPKNPQLR